MAASVSPTRRVAAPNAAAPSGVAIAGASSDAYSRATKAYAPTLSAMRTQTKIAR